MHLAMMFLLMLVVAIFFKEGAHLNEVDKALIYFIVPGEDKEDAIISEKFGNIDTSKVELKMYQKDDAIQRTIHHNISVNDANKLTKQLLELA